MNIETLLADVRNTITNRLVNYYFKQRLVNGMSPLGKLLKWGTFAYEAFLALPIIGGLFVVANAWVPLGIAFLLHVIAIVVLMKERVSIVGNMIGVLTSIVAIIPFVGWIMHGITAIALLVEGVSASRRTPRY